MRVPRLFLLAVALSAPLAACGTADPNAARDDDVTPPLLIAAAADLRPAFTELVPVFERRTGYRATLTFGASGQLAQQLEEGAPFALFASASIEYVDQVLAAGRGDRSTRAIYAYGRLSVWSPDRTVELEDLASPSITRVAIANPQHAPYGKAAIQALRAAGLYAAVRPKLVYGENVGAAQQLAASGNADAAIIGRALALAADGKQTAVSPRLHAPIAQGLIVTGAGSPGRQARAFIALLRSQAGQAILRKDGFALPGDPDAATTP